MQTIVSSAKNLHHGIEKRCFVDASKVEKYLALQIVSSRAVFSIFIFENSSLSVKLSCNVVCGFLKKKISVADGFLFLKKLDGSMVKAQDS